jgi:hypothetical protein
MAHVGMHGLTIKLFDKFCRLIIIVMAIFSSKFGFFLYGLSLMITTWICICYIFKICMIKKTIRDMNFQNWKLWIIILVAKIYIDFEII